MGTDRDVDPDVGIPSLGGNIVLTYKAPTCIHGGLTSKPRSCFLWEVMQVIQA